MKGKQNVLTRDLSLHEIKDKIQLKFSKQHADFIADNLEELIKNTDCVAPVRKIKNYKLKPEDNRNLTHSVKSQEKHWEEAIFQKWKNSFDFLDPRVPFKKIVSHQVMLRDTNKDKKWGELDLLGATEENIPVAIELKINTNEELLRAIVEVLANAVAIRKAFSGFGGCALRSDWDKEVGKFDNLVDLPLAIMAPTTYWEKVLSRSPKKIGFQTSLTAQQSIIKLLTKMRRLKYPLTFVEIKAEEAKSGLPVIIDAIVKEMPNLFLDDVRKMIVDLPEGEQTELMKIVEEINELEDSCEEKKKKVTLVKGGSKRTVSRRVPNIDEDPDNADWIRIVRAERIAQQVPGGKKIWESALKEAGGSRSGALMVFYRLLQEAGIEEPD